MHLRSGKSVPHLTEFKTRTRMARPPPSNRNNDLPNMEGQPTQTSVSNANINSGIGAIPDQTVGTISSTASKSSIWHAYIFDGRAAKLSTKCRES